MFFGRDGRVDALVALFYLLLLYARIVGLLLVRP